ncbi:MAG TPA: hypothetical protein VGN17_21330 [Bryobacteraceae bacterium]|jgi:uncharacterized protein (TIGR03437 family)
MRRSCQAVLILWSAAAASLALAQSTFPGFTQGNLVVSRTVYTGDANTIAVGQSLPPVCPASAETAKKGQCATKATANGAYPGVWANDTIDGSFGITSPIFLDQLNPLTGVVINTLPIPTNMVNTSFSSKSELAVNRSADGTALTFMGYVAPPNTIDVSNSNTPAVNDPTNPVGSSYYRAVVQVNANGTIQVTPTNAYSGNNGRAAILANGLYYMAGNNNNGTGTPANLVASTGVEIATPGQPLNTTPTQIGTFSIASLTDPSTGKPFAADKAGKDTNFRGLTIFNNTVYVTKGSGGNGVNTVYQVGAAGTLPTLATASAAPITILPGFPTALAKTADKTSDYPFGIWFANATTLYVADEGDGAAADAAGSTTAGLQKWTLVNGAWKMLYVLQNGLSLGQPYTIPNYPASLNPATGGLRNLTGNVNSDGTVTLWAVTSTVSSNGDPGADPNKLVMIVDTLANTDPAVAAKEQFTTLKTANAGEALRGVSLSPSTGTTPATGVPEILSAATPGITSLAPGSLAFALGQGFATGLPDEILGPLPTYWEGTSVSIVDSKGAANPAPLVFVSQDQVTFQVPTTVATGTAQVKITGGGSTQTASNVVIASPSPALFTINGSGLAAAYAVRVSGTTQIVEPAYSINTSGGFTAAPISLGASTDQTYLSLFGTGLQSPGVSGTTVTINGVNAPVLFVGAQGSVPGLDQVNVQIPSSLAGTGNANVQLTAGTAVANQVQVTIK